MLRKSGLLLAALVLATGPLAAQAPQPPMSVDQQRRLLNTQGVQAQELAGMLHGASSYATLLEIDRNISGEGLPPGLLPKFGAFGESPEGAAVRRELGKAKPDSTPAQLKAIGEKAYQLTMDAVRSIAQKTQELPPMPGLPGAPVPNVQAMPGAVQSQLTGGGTIPGAVAAENAPSGSGAPPPQGARNAKPGSFASGFPPPPPPGPGPGLPPGTHDKGMSLLEVRSGDYEGPKRDLPQLPATLSVPAGVSKGLADLKRRVNAALAGAPGDGRAADAAFAPGGGSVVWDDNGMFAGGGWRVKNNAELASLIELLDGANPPDVGDPKALAAILKKAKGDVQGELFSGTPEKERLAGQKVLAIYSEIWSALEARETAIRGAAPPPTPPAR